MVAASRRAPSPRKETELAALPAWAVVPHSQFPEVSRARPASVDRMVSRGCRRSTGVFEKVGPAGTPRSGGAKPLGRVVQRWPRPLARRPQRAVEPLGRVVQRCSRPLARSPQLTTIQNGEEKEPRKPLGRVVQRCSRPLARRRQRAVEPLGRVVQKCSKPLGRVVQRCSRPLA